MHALADAAHDRRGVFDLSPVGLVERIEVVFDAADQLSQPRDLGLRRHRFVAGPVVEFGCGPDPFAVTQQRVEVVPQLGQVGRVGAEVPAAQAPKPERAGPAAGLNVRSLGADAERDRDLTTARRWCSLSNKTRGWLHTCSPRPLNCTAARESTALCVLVAVTE